MQPTKRKVESDSHSEHTCDMSTVTLEPHAVFVLTQSVLVTCTHELQYIPHICHKHHSCTLLMFLGRTAWYLLFEPVQKTHCSLCGGQ